MRKALFFNETWRFYCIFLCVFLLTAQRAEAQCGTSSFPTTGTPFSPTSTWQSINIGSDQFADFHVGIDTIYSFYFTSGTASGSGYLWDMTMANGSAIINYDGSATPLHDSWTGGLGLSCSRTSRPGSAEWFADYSGLVRINAHTFDGVSCQNFVAGQGSATLQYRECPPTADPGPGINAWNVDAYVSTDLAIPKPNARYGYYTDNISDLHFLTTNYYPTDSAPKRASTWTGCDMPNENYVLKARRKGFPCGYYRIDVNQANEGVSVLVNHNQVYTHGCCLSTATSAGNFVLGPNDEVEVRLSAFCSQNILEFTLVPVSYTALNGGTIGGVPNNTVICEGTTPGTFTNVTGASGGTVGLNNGGASYTYQWEVSTDGGATFNGTSANGLSWTPGTPIPAGATYVIRRAAIDVCDTAYSNTITLIGKPSPNGSLTPANQSVCPGNTAVLTFDFNTGVSPFYVVVSDGVNRIVRSGVVTGDTLQVAPLTTTGFHFDSIIDAYGCARATSFTAGAVVTVAPVSIIFDSITNVQCAGTASGSIYITPSGGTPPYTYQWSTGATTEDINSALAGPETVTVTDSRGCTASNSTIIGSPFALSVNVALSQNPGCYRDSSGLLLIQANGGVPPYTYLWSNGETTQDIDSLQQGTYNVTVSDHNGCTQTIGKTLTEPTPISDSVAGTNVICAGGGGGTATVVFVNGGTGPYQFLWSNFRTTQTISNIHGGEYIVQITDLNGCKKYDSVFVNEPDPLVITSTSSNVACPGNQNGTVDITVTGGLQPYGYVWSTGATTQNVSGLSGGPVGVTVNDANGCTASQTFNIIEPSPLFPNVSSHNALCAQGVNGGPDSTGYIKLTPSGGTQPFTYQWSDGETTNLISGLPPNLYQYTITDARGCTYSDTLRINAPTPLLLVGYIFPVSCPGVCDGYVLTQVNGGAPPYTYYWSINGVVYPGQNNQNINNRCGGDAVQLYISDANGCQASSIYNFNNPQLFQLSISKTDPTCANTCNGSATISVSGGTTPYLYLWNNLSPNATASGLCGGSYNVLITDSNGCRATDSITLVAPPALNITGVVTNATCNGTSTGGVDITVTGGTGAYGYLWSNNATTQDISGVPAGPYNVVVTDAANCTDDAGFTVSEANTISTNVSTSAPHCANGHDGFISMEVTGGNEPYQFSWNTTPPQTGATATNIGAGDYTLTITDAGNCSVTVSATLTQPAPVVATTSTIGSRCFNAGSGTVVAQVLSGGTPPFTYLLNGVLQASDTFNNLLPGNYTLLISDANGCFTNDTFSITSPPAFSVHLTTDMPNILTGMQTQLSAVTDPPGQAIEYIWSPLTIDSADVFDFTGCGNPALCPTPYVKPPFTTTFTVMAVNSDSCIVSDTVTIYVVTQPTSFVPSAFTPNGDGLNDRFEFAVLGASTIEVTIFDRWGELVYHNSNQFNGMNGTDGWDGTKNGTLAPNDTYVYQLTITYFDGTVRNETGTVTLMR